MKVPAILNWQENEKHCIIGFCFSEQIVRMEIFEHQKISVPAGS